MKRKKKLYKAPKTKAKAKSGSWWNFGGGKGKKGKSMKGLGNIGEAEGDVGNTLKHGVLNVGSTLAGGVLGTAVGKPALAIGAVTALVGLYNGSMPITSAGGGMIVGSLVKPNKDKQAELDAKNATEASTVKKLQNRVSVAIATYYDSLKENAYLSETAKTETAQTETTKTETAQTETTKTETPATTDATKVMAGLGGMVGDSQKSKIKATSLGNYNYERAGLNTTKVNVKNLGGFDVKRIA